jgi:RNA polymerase sigma factor (sigma-70 family)
VPPLRPINMPPETATSGFADFLAANSPLLARLRTGSGAARWSVSLDDFAQALYRSAVHRFGAALPGPIELDRYLGALHLEDLALVCALRCGAEGAWEEFVAGYRPVLYSAARAVVGAAGESRARDLADSLYAELYGLNRSGRQGRPLLEYFHGRSKLSTWLRAVLAQRHVDGLRAGQRTDSFDSDSPAQARLARRSPAPVAAPDVDRERLLPRLQQAVSTALANLPPGDCLLLSLYYVQDMTLAQIARVQGVHEATISRHLDRIRRELRSAVEQMLVGGRTVANGSAALPALSPAEVDLCFAYAVEDSSLDLGRSLNRPASTGPEDD